MEKIGDSMKGGRSFGPAFERDGTTVIPVAYVFGGGGGGAGTPKVKAPESFPRSAETRSAISGIRDSSHLLWMPAMGTWRG